MLQQQMQQSEHFNISSLTWPFSRGVAGGIKDARLRDVVVADEVLSYEFVRVNKEEKIQVRPSGFHSGFDMVQIAFDEAITRNWLGRLGNSEPENAPKAFVGTIASGEALVASTSSALYRFLRNNYNQAIAVEMKGYGFLQACDAHKIPGLVIRGISDLLSRKKETDAGGSQEMAAMNATVFTLQVLAQLDDGTRCSSNVINVPELPANFLPRTPDFQEVKEALLSEEKRTVGITGQKVGLLGMDGIGKTVLAAAMAKDEDVRKRFNGSVG